MQNRLTYVVEAGDGALAVLLAAASAERLVRVHSGRLDCNADEGIRDFEAWFSRWEQRRRQFPVAGATASAVSRCVGWPHPVRPDRFAYTGSNLLLIGHRFETVTPVVWAGDMKARIGGVSLTVNDDAHGSTIKVACASNVVNFLVTGARPPARCAGIPEPIPGTVSPAELTRR